MMIIIRKTIVTVTATVMTVAVDTVYGYDDNSSSKKNKKRKR